MSVSFELTDDQRELRDLAHEFAERELRPIAAECVSMAPFSPWTAPEVTCPDLTLTITVWSSPR